MVVNSSDYPTTFSHEIAGVVTAIGQDVKDLKTGDHVVGFAFNRFATYQRTPATMVKKLREMSSLEVGSFSALRLALMLTVVDYGDLTDEFRTCSAWVDQPCLCRSPRCELIHDSLITRN